MLPDGTVSHEPPAGMITYVNSRYQVAIRRDHDPAWGDVVHLSIKNNDKSAAHDWRDYQRIKNELCGPETEAVEIYPAESRLVDAANQFHLWVLMSRRVPWGFSSRLVAAKGIGYGSQRPWPEGEEPADLSEHTAADLMKGMKSC